MPLTIQSRIQVLTTGTIVKAFWVARHIQKAKENPYVFAIQSPSSLQDLLSLLSGFLGPEIPLISEGASLWFQGKEDIALAWFLNRLASPKPGIIFLPDTILLKPCPHPQAYRSLKLELHTNLKLSRENVIETLKRWGYDFVYRVAAPGQAAKRGGILDIFPLGEESAIRFDWFGGTLDSIREFDIETQRTTRKVESAVLRPAAVQIEEKAPFGAHLLEADVLLVENVENLVENGDDIGRIRTPIGCFTGNVTAFGPVHRQEVLGPSVAIHPKTKPLASFGIHNLGSFEGGLKGRLTETVATLLSYGLTPILLLRTESQAQRVMYLLMQLKIPCQSLTSLPPTHELPRGESVIILVCPTEENGEVIEDEGLAFLTEQDLFGKKIPQKAQKQRADTLFSFKNLEIGEPLIHTEHGLGLYQGLKTVRVLGVQKECIELLYDKGDKLFIPVEKTGVLMRYMGGNGHEVKLATLGSKDFERAKSRAQKRILEMAGELLEIQANRELTQKEPYLTEEALLREFESLFPYDETPDQTKAIEEVYKDLESDKLMDRLVCGDAGYGKTEVAMRAAFKTVLMGKQVAVLAPTTVLAYQHLRTFKERFRAFPVHIEGLSRFTPHKSQAQIINNTIEGKVDILIGTHRILEKDVSFKNLGLLVIDEEQRFGVSHKERLKTIKTGVNVLSLSATPIPRTLHMSLSGLKDLSIIQTAPSERRKITTEILPFSEAILKEVIERELQRKGQVFFVHNRIEELDKFARLFSGYFPTARIGIGHAQMDESALEEVMVSFFSGKIDILISTSIVESGLDIPTANTMIVYRADLFGLSQLYQLKGRVGRSDKEGYFYLIVPKSEALSKKAQDRVDAMIAHDTMGSSFELAVRDLEVRGAGNLLGREQSGVIKEIGLELYFNLLKEAIEGLRTTQGDTKTKVIPLDPEIKIEAEALIPAPYMPQERERLYNYRRIATALDDRELDRIREEIQDIYGELPIQVKNLLTLKKVWILAKKLGVQKILPLDKEILFEIHPDWHGAFGEACLKELFKDPDVRFSEEGWVYTKKDKAVSLIEQTLLTLERWLDWMNRKEVMV